MTAPPPGKIITFYSYKGGAGRSMVLSNVAWILASNGKRVLVIDWDLEAPGLHRYFDPFLIDRDLSSEGVIDFVINYAIQATNKSEQAKRFQPEWYKAHANILRYAESLQWEFPDGGKLDFVPAGRQGPSYSTRVNQFNWQNFYDRLEGGVFLEAVKERVKEEYDYILIDSRTGVSDTSGICTVQMPDILVICFTLNNQNIDGASAVANSVYEMRGESGILIFPVAMRIENAEKEKLEIRRKLANAKFAQFPHHIQSKNREKYSKEVQFPYIPYYAYEEILATFSDTPKDPDSILTRAERLTAYITQGDVKHLNPPLEPERSRVLADYEGRAALVGEYEHDIFLSSNKSDEEWTARLARRLEQEAWQGRRIKVFFAPWDIRPGHYFPKEMEKGLAGSRKIGLIMSPEAMSSGWVELERMVTTHISIEERYDRLIPLYRRDCEIPSALAPILYLDFRDDSKFEESYRTLLAIVRDEPIPRVSSSDTIPSIDSRLLIPRPPITGFVARRDKNGQDIVTRLKEELSPGKDRLVALWGIGGAGKTTIAAEVARSLSETFNERIIWVIPEGRANFSLDNLLDEIAAQSGRPDLRALSPRMKEEEIRAKINSEPMLIIIDGFEAVSPEEQKRLLRFLSDRVFNSTLITTRQRVDTARNIVIDGMSFSEADDLLDLLIEQANDPEMFAALDRSHIIGMTEGNPLILGWLIGQIDLAQEPREVFSELAGCKSEAARHIFDRAFNLPQLGNDGRDALLALSLFTPSASRSALAEVAGFHGDITRLNSAVRNLAAMRLIKSVNGGARLMIEGLTREFALARLKVDDRADEFRERLVSFFLEYAESHSRKTPDNFDALEAEIDNLFAVVNTSYESENWQNAIRVCVAIGDFLYIRGYWSDAILYGQEALKVARAFRDQTRAAFFLIKLALINQRRGDLAEARRLYNESHEISKRQGDLTGIAASLRGLAILAQDQGGMGEARMLYSKSLEISKRLNDLTGTAATLHELGKLAQDQDEADEAHKLYDESLEISKRLNDLTGIAASLRGLAILAHDQGEMDEAHKLYDESLKISKMLSDLPGMAVTLHELGRLAHDLDEVGEAHKLYGESLEISKMLGDLPCMAVTLHELGRLAETGIDMREASRLFREALILFEKLRSPKAELVRQSLKRVMG